MSRAYRIRVKETVRRVVRAEDHVSTQLEMLDILPADRMADLLAAELIRQGFERDGDTVKRTDGDTEIVVDLKTATVTVRTEKEDKVELTKEKIGSAWDDQGPSAKILREKLQAEAEQELKQDVVDRQQEIQRKVTDKLEGQLADLRQELDQATNRATAEALKQKAAQIGQIKELTEDPQSGSLTIVVEV